MKKSTAWRRWRTICGWLAVVSATSWAAKFVVWAVIAERYTNGQIADSSATPKVLAVLVTFLLPTLGSVCGLISWFGLATPLAVKLPLWAGILSVLGIGLAAAVLASFLINLTAHLFDSMSAQVWVIEGSDLTAALVQGALALYLLAGSRTRAIQPDALPAS